MFLRKKTKFGKGKISKCLKELIGRGIITYTKGNSKKAANQYYLSKLDQCDLTGPTTEPVKENKPEKPLSTGSTTEPDEVQPVPPQNRQPVPPWDSKKTNNKNINNNKNTKEERMAKFKLIKAQPPIDDFLSINNSLVQQTLREVSHAVQRNWVEIYKDKGIEWLKNEIIDAVAYHAAKGTKNYGTAITTWLKRSITPPPWIKDNPKKLANAAEADFIKEFGLFTNDGE